MVKKVAWNLGFHRLLYLYGLIDHDKKGFLVCTVNRCGLIMSE